jgi:hypothetical protein
VLALDDLGLIDELGSTLRSAGFTGDGVRDALETNAPLLSRSSDRLVHVRRLVHRGPLGTLIRLLVLDVPVAEVEAAEAFAPLTLEHVARLGLLARRDGTVSALVRVVPHDELLVVSDRRLSPGQPAAADHVAGVHAPSLMLSHLTVRRRVEEALDVGTGNGIQAILASRHSERVVATDVNERALQFARFNAALNGAPNVELRAGSFFAPVRGERFGLVVSNPPYVISPESTYLFRDSGLSRDSVSHGVCRSCRRPCRRARSPPCS